MLKTSTEIGSGAKRIGAEKAIEYIAKSGFSAWDFQWVICAVTTGKINELLKVHRLFLNPIIYHTLGR